MVLNFSLPVGVIRSFANPHPLFLLTYETYDTLTMYFIVFNTIFSVYSLSLMSLSATCLFVQSCFSRYLSTSSMHLFRVSFEIVIWYHFLFVVLKGFLGVLSDSISIKYPVRHTGLVHNIVADIIVSIGGSIEQSR